MGFVAGLQPLWGGDAAAGPLGRGGVQAGLYGQLDSA